MLRWLEDLNGVTGTDGSRGHHSRVHAPLAGELAHETRSDLLQSPAWSAFLGELDLSVPDGDRRAWRELHNTDAPDREVFSDIAGRKVQRLESLRVGDQKLTNGLRFEVVVAGQTPLFEDGIEHSLHGYSAAAAALNRYDGPVHRRRL